jgi:putative nucleotidyltransferase with HDIG domain
MENSEAAVLDQTRLLSSTTAKVTGDSRVSAENASYRPPTGRLAEGLRHERTADWTGAIAIYEDLLRGLPAGTAGVNEVVIALLRIAGIHRHAGRRNLALEIVDLGVFIAEANALAPELAHALVAQSSILLSDDRVDEAERIALVGRVQAEATGAEIAVAIADNLLGVIASRSGDVTRALLRFASSLAYGQRAGDQFLISMCLNNIGRAYLALGMPEEAAQRLEDAVALGWEQHQLTAAQAECTLAMLHVENGEPARAQRHARRAMEAATRLGSPRLAADAYIATASVATSMGQFDAAATQLRLAESLARREPQPESDAELATCELSLHVGAGRVGLALTALERSEECYAIAPDVWGQRRMLVRAAQLRELLDSVCEKWLQSLSAILGDAAQHSHRIAALSSMLAQAAGLGEAERRSIAIGALLHDIGYLSLPAEILARTSELNDLEREIVRAHSEFGDAFLDDAGFPRSVRSIVRHHHERWDGAGYPDGLRGEAIPIGSRIVAIAERYDALRSARGSRQSLPEGLALRRLAADAGSAFDERLITKFAAAIRSGFAETSATIFADRIPVATSAIETTETPTGMRAPRDFLAALRRIVGTRYRIERELSVSAMAHVYLGEDPVLGRPVVIKALRSEEADNDSIARFRREMNVAARLRHPNVLPVLDARANGPILYFVTPFIDGGSLRQRIDRGPVTIPEARRILHDIASGLAEAHAHGVVHRDLKPENVLLDRDRNGGALLADFGIARLVTAAARSERGAAAAMLTQAGVSLGTPAYMAPEQVFAQTDLDARVDVYAFGLVAFELLAGEPPFVRSTSREVMVAHLTCPAPDITIRRPDIPPELAAVIGRALEKDPAGRFRDGGLLLKALDGCVAPSTAPIS